MKILIKKTKEELTMLFEPKRKYLLKPLYLEVHANNKIKA